MKDPKGQLYLQAANEKKSYPDLYPESELKIFGVVKGSFRRLG